MRKLNEEEAIALDRYTKQQRQLRRVEQTDRACRSSNALIDRIAHDLGDADAALMARLMTRKAANYNGCVHSAALLRFVQKLAALSAKRVHAIKEIQL